MRNRSLWLGGLILVLGAAGCGTSNPPSDVQGTDATDVTGSNDVPSTTDGSAAGLAPCLNESDFVTGMTTVAFGGALANNYSPRCLTVAIGATVTFNGDFSFHPLAASTRGSANNPIPPTGTGSTATATFPAAGLYPYYCLAHGTNDGGGMAGVIRVQ